MRFDTVGLVVNPVAGLGAAHNSAAARQVVSSLRPNQVVTGPGDLGADAVSDAQVIPAPDIQGRAVTQFLARQIISTGVDVLIVVGGDGTMADVAFGAASNNDHLPSYALDVSGSFLKTARAGDLLVAEATLVHTTKRTGFYRMQGSNGDELIATFNGTVFRKVER